MRKYLIIYLLLFGSCASDNEIGDKSQDKSLVKASFYGCEVIKSDLAKVNLISKFENRTGSIESFYMSVYDDLKDNELFTYHVFLEKDYLMKKDSIHKSWINHSCAINNNASVVFVFGKYIFIPGCGRSELNENKKIADFYERIKSKVVFNDSTKAHVR